MVSSEVQRTLVKSPPELWAELSDPAALARHLGELGEIRIVKTKPEERVEWEAENASGTVLIKASGWGTKVKLSLTREVAAPAVEEPDEDEPHTEQPPAAVEVVSEVAEPEASPGAAETEVAEPEFAPETPEAIKPRRGFFSRLFRRRPPPSAVPISVPEHAAAETPAQPAAEAPQETTSDTPHTLVAETPCEPPADLSAELRAAEEAATEEVTEMLTAVLDRLGAAHHRPFSRA